MAALKDLRQLEQMFKKIALESGHPTAVAATISLNLAALIVLALKLILEHL